MSDSNNAHRRYLLRIGILMLIYVAFLLPGAWLASREMIGESLTYVFAIGAGLSVAGMFWAIGMLLVEETDEFLKLLLVRQSLVATAIAMSGVTIWGFLEDFELVPHVTAYWWAILWFGGLGIGALFNKASMDAIGKSA